MGFLVHRISICFILLKIAKWFMCGCAVFVRAIYEHFSCSTSSPELGNVNF